MTCEAALVVAEIHAMTVQALGALGKGQKPITLLASRRTSWRLASNGKGHRPATNLPRPCGLEIRQGVGCIPGAVSASGVASEGFRELPLGSDKWASVRTQQHPQPAASNFCLGVAGTNDNVVLKRI